MSIYFSIAEISKYFGLNKYKIRKIIENQDNTIYIDDCFDVEKYTLKRKKNTK